MCFVVKKGLIYSRSDKMKIVKINEQEIILDYRAASKILEDAINHGTADYVVTGCSKYLENIIITLEEADIDSPFEYIIAPISAKSEADLIASIRSRYDAGFTTISTFNTDKLFWGLFAKKL